MSVWCVSNSRGRAMGRGNVRVRWEGEMSLWDRQIELATQRRAKWRESPAANEQRAGTVTLLADLCIDFWFTQLFQYNVQIPCLLRLTRHTALSSTLTCRSAARPCIVIIIIRTFSTAPNLTLKSLRTYIKIPKGLQQQDRQSYKTRATGNTR